MSSIPSITDRIAGRVQIILRIVVVTVTAYPALRKFFEYSYRVGEFESYGMPWPELTVLLTGAIELVAIALIAVGFAGRLGAGALVVGMVVAMVAAGPNPASALVLVASTAILLLGTGPYSYWDPTLIDLGKKAPRETLSKITTHD